MADDDLRAVFHRIDDGPPLGIDADTVMTRGRRIRARRAALAVVGSTLAIAAATTIGLTTGAGDIRSPEIVRPANPPTTTTTTGNQPLPAPPTNGNTPSSDNQTPPDVNAPAPDAGVPPGPGGGLP